MIVIIGATASGKSEYAVELAHQHHGEIISADSRQVYRGLDIGTGKVEGRWKEVPSNELRVTSQQKNAAVATFKNWKLLARHSLDGGGEIGNSVFVYKGIPHHCIDYIDPTYQYSVADFKRDAEAAIADIVSRGKTPIICGGTGQFVDALVFSEPLPDVEPDPAFRKTLEGKSPAELYALLQKQDPERAANIDPHNPRRLVRALEIIHATGKPVPAVGDRTHRTNRTYKSNGSQELPIEIHYLNPPREELYKKIEARLKERVTHGMVEEVSHLHDQGLSWERMEALGLEYRYIARFLQLTGNATIPDSTRPKTPGNPESMYAPGNFIRSPEYTQLLTQIKRYAKRQQTWFKKYLPISVQI